MLTQEQCEAIRRHIQENLSGELGLKEMAAFVGCSSRYLNTLFQRSFGCSVHQYVIRQRLEEATRLLTSTHISLAEIATKVGFCSQSHFTAAFRRAYEVTPLRYRGGARGSAEARKEHLREEIRQWLAQHLEANELDVGVKAVQLTLEQPGFMVADMKPLRGHVQNDLPSQ